MEPVKRSDWLWWIFLVACLVVASGIVWAMCQAPPAKAAPSATASVLRIGDGTQVLCSSPPVPLADTTLNPPPADASWLTVSVPAGGVTVFLGGAAVGVNGIAIDGGERETFPVRRGTQLYCFAAAPQPVGVVVME